jgi:predicted nucleotidyltransferase
MPKVEEDARVPALGEEEVARLTRALDRDEVVAASLFGSQAGGGAGRLSDVDVAVWTRPDLSSERLSELRLELADAAAKALDTGEVDLVVLNAAPALLRHRAIRDGERFLERSRSERVRLETASLLEFFDTAPLREALDAARRKRLGEGTFGRR